MRDITFLELVPILLALFIWGVEYKNKKIVFRVDNEALVEIINERTSKSKREMQLIRPVVLLTMQYNIQFKQFIFRVLKMKLQTRSLGFRCSVSGK